MLTVYVAVSDNPATAAASVAIAVTLPSANMSLNAMLFIFQRIFGGSGVANFKEFYSGCVLAWFS